MSILHQSISGSSLILFVAFLIPGLLFSPSPTVAQAQTGSASVCDFQRDLQIGSRGSDVTCLQTYLKSTGHLSGTVTDYFGPNARQAVISWQQSQGITPAEGYFGPASRSRYESIQGIQSPEPTPTPTPTTVNIPDTTSPEITTTTSVDRSALQQQIRALMMQVIDLLNQLLERRLSEAGIDRSQLSQLSTQDTATPRSSSGRNRNSDNSADDDSDDEDDDSGGGGSDNDDDDNNGGGGSGGGGGNNNDDGSDDTDTTAPTISSIQAAPTAGGATITWSTNEAADSVVEYGTTASYGSSESNTADVTSHSVDLTGLSSDTTYHYRVQSTDAAGNTQTDSDRTFTTNETASTTADENRVTNSLAMYYPIVEGEGDTLYDYGTLQYPVHMSDSSNLSWTTNGFSPSGLLTYDGGVRELGERISSSDEITVEAWVRPTNFDGSEHVILEFDTTSHRDGVELSHDDAEFRAIAKTDQNDQRRFFTAGALTEGEVAHMVFTYQGNTGRTYLNGQLLEETTFNSPIEFRNDHQFALGSSITGSQVFNGDIYLAAVYTKALSQTEIQQNYDEGYDFSVPAYTKTPKLSTKHRPVKPTEDDDITITAEADITTPGVVHDMTLSVDGSTYQCSNTCSQTLSLPTGNHSYSVTVTDQYGNTETVTDTIEVISTISTTADAGAVLPQDYDWQIVLRNYMKALEEDDFSVTLEDLDYYESYFSSNDELYQYFVGGGGGDEEIRVQPSLFVLDNIEDGGSNDILLPVGRGNGEVSPVRLTQRIDWEYPGNPYYESGPLSLRNFVMTAVDMSMVVEELDNGEGDRSDFVGGHLIRSAYAYHIIKDTLPTQVQNAYEDGMMNLFSKIESYGPQGTHSDMDHFALVGMRYAGLAMDDDAVYQRALDYNDVLHSSSNHWKDACYADHGGAYDPSYHGITNHYMTWAALLDKEYNKNYVLEDRINCYQDLRTHLALWDQTRWVSPTHYATYNTRGVENEQWTSYATDVAAGALSDNGKPLIWGDTRHNPDHESVPTETEMRGDIRNGLQYKMDTSPINLTADSYSSDHWLGTDHAAIHYLYPDGFYDEIKQLEDQNSELMAAPVLRDGDYIKTFADDFLSAKKGSFATILATDKLSWWAGGTDPSSGFGGGALSAFWTSDTGAVILGQKSQYSSGNEDTWSNYLEWPTHAISGESGTGDPFSSARQRFPEATYSVNGDTSATVTATGTFDGDDPDPYDVVGSSAEYEREFVIDSNGVHITSSVTSDGTDQISQLYEIIPFYNQDNYYDRFNPRKTDLFFRVNGTWESASTNYVTADSIRADRLDGSVYVNFDSPQQIKLSPSGWKKSDDYSYGSQRNVLIDLLGSGGSTVSFPTSKSVSYTITTTAP